MGSDETTPPKPMPESSLRKHRSPPDEDGMEEGSKRRKHHHHRHRHHHHRHGHRRHRDRSKHGRGEDEAVGEEGEEQVETLGPPVPGNSLSTGLSRPPLDLDDREEGEILEDEEGAYVDGEKGEVLPSGGVASSDFEPGEFMPDNRLAITPKVEDIFSGKGLKELSLQEDIEEDASRSSRNYITFDRFHEISNGEDAMLIDKSKGVKNYPAKDETLVFSGEEYNNGTGRESIHSRSRSPLKGTEKEKEFSNVETKNMKRRAAKSQSLVSEESLHFTKENKRDDTNLERHGSRRRSESRDSHRGSPGNRNKSLSPESLRDMYKAAGRSPSYNTFRDDVFRRDRSRSHDHVRERSRERDPKSYADHTARASSSDRVRMDSDRERGARNYRLDRHDNTRSRMRDAETYRPAVRERELSSSYSRHDGREDRYGSWDMEREKDRGRDKDRDRVKLRDLSRGRERDREKVRARDMSRERGRDRDDKDKDNGRGRDRDREIRRDGDRDQGRQMEKDRARSRDRLGDSRHPRYNDAEYHRDRKRFQESAKETSFTRHDYGAGKEKLIREEEEEDDYQDRIEQQLAKQEEEDPEKVIEESRKRRLAILEKYKQQQLQQHVDPPFDNHEKEEKAPTSEGTKPPVNADSVPLPELTENRHGPSDVYVADQLFSVGKSPQQNGTSAPERTTGAGGLGDGTPKSERSADMFCDDIFGESPAGIRKLGKGGDLKIDRSGLHDNWDDAEGYYSYRFGEVLDGRYEVIASHGKGVFSTVVRAKDLKAGKGDPEEVAIKIIRNNDTMYKAGLEELIILKKLVGADPEDKRHCVRFLSSFKYRNHLCLVFESLHMNLREVLKKFGRNIGLKLTAVRAYAKQLFIALKHLRNCGVLHCDIKPDNMLVNEAKNVLKLCDFGNAMFAGKNEITPYLVSRFYRAPEIILGLPYDHPMDIWSVGCCLYELYSGKVLFPGPSNNDMLRLHMELKGPFPKKILRKGAFTDQHFDQDLNFHATEEDPVTKKTMKRLLLNIKPKDIGTLITSSPAEDPKMLAHFKDLLERVFVLDPDKRMTVSQALSHPFITGK